MKVLVTGGTGVVGANLVRALLRQGYDVRVLLRPGSDAIALRLLPVERWFGDVLDERSLTGMCDGCGLVFHAAAVFAYAGYSQQALDELAVRGTKNVLREAARCGVDRVVVTSSTVTLGSSSDPVVRDESSAADEEYPSRYTLSKIRQEAAAQEFARDAGIDIVVVCPGLTVGAFDYRLSPSNASIVNYLNDPLRSTFLGGCNIVSAHDVADGHIIAAERGAPGCRYVLGGENLTWRDVHTQISELGGTFGPSLTLNHTATYMAAAATEIAARFMNTRPAVTREEAAMACRYYWYSSETIGQLGYSARTARAAIAEAIAWLMHRAFLNESVVDRLKPDELVTSYLRTMIGGESWHPEAC